MKPPSSGPTAAAIAAGGADQRVDLLLRRALEVAVDQRLHRGQQQRRAEAADDRPEDDDRGEALRERHRQRADRVAEQAEDVGALAADEVADLAADEDERGRHERLERDRATARRSPSCRGRATTAEIDTFISDVSTTSTNIAMLTASKARVALRSGRGVVHRP